MYYDNSSDFGALVSYDRGESTLEKMVYFSKTHNFWTNSSQPEMKINDSGVFVYGNLSIQANNTFIGDKWMSSNNIDYISPMHTHEGGSPSGAIIPHQNNDQTASRSFGTTYTNTNNRPIIVWIYVETSVYDFDDSAYVSMTPKTGAGIKQECGELNYDGSASNMGRTKDSYWGCFMIVQESDSYVVNSNTYGQGSVSLIKWMETDF